MSTIINDTQSVTVTNAVRRDHFRAAFWTDGQAEVLLTIPEEAALSDEALLMSAETEAESTGLDTDGGEIVIGEWTA